MDLGILKGVVAVSTDMLAVVADMEADAKILRSMVGFEYRRLEIVVILEASKGC